MDKKMPFLIFFLLKKISFLKKIWDYPGKESWRDGKDVEAAIL
jgi:hypothetical protein